MTVDWKKQQELDARIGYMVGRLASLPRGIDEVLAHLFLGPRTLDELRNAMVRDRTIRRREEAPSVRQDPSYIEFPVDVEVDRSLLYDLGHLAEADVVHLNDGVLSIHSGYREGVRVFLHAISARRFFYTSGSLRNTVSKAVRRGEAS